MHKYRMVVFTAAKEGREKECNDWYDSVHLRDLVACPGVRCAQRFDLRQPLAGEKQFPYLAVYEIETDDLQGTLAEINNRAASGRIVFSDAVADTWAAVFEEHGPVVRQKA